jgi:hypothetical protein
MLVAGSAAPRARSAPSHLLGMSAGTWLRILQENRFAVDSPFLLSALSVTAASVLNGVCRVFDDWSVPKEAAELPADPIFIVGHWRSGTTLLHNLLSVDKQFATPNFCQVFFPNSFITAGKPLRWFVNRALPKKRQIDDMEIGPDLPQEDEFALCALTGLSPYIAYAFPRNWENYNRYLTFNDASDEEIQRWKNAMRSYVHKLTRVYQRPLMLKSPPHTARLRLLLDIFPNAKFVHVHRNPYEVFQSSCRTLSIGPPLLQMQRFDFNDLEELVLGRYEALYDRFLEQRELVPKGNLYEMSFDSLTRDPVSAVKSVYEALSLPGLDALEDDLRAYVNTLSGYKPNLHAGLSESSSALVAERWKRFFSSWGYSMEPQAAAP